MGAFLPKPKTEKTNDEGQGPDFRYVMASMQGWRKDMEDSHQIKVALSDQAPFKDWSYFAVFDGHAGTQVSMHLSGHLLDKLMATEEFAELATVLTESNGELTERARELITQGIKTGFLNLDEELCNLPVPCGEEKEKSGSTALCAILTPEYVFFANLGDSRGLLGRKNQELFSTMDHKPYLAKERNRIVRAGGTVMIQRVNGTLAVSRAFGDFDYKNAAGFPPTEQVVSPEPDVYIVKRDRSEDQFILLACDGIFDVLGNEEVCMLLRSRLTSSNDLTRSSNQVLDYCLSKGSRDNMTMVMVVFEAAPQMDEELSQKENEWMEQVREKATELAQRYKESAIANRRDKECDAGIVISLLRAETNLEESPLYGGLDLARSVIDSIVGTDGDSEDEQESRDEIADDCDDDSAVSGNSNSLHTVSPGET